MAKRKRTQVSARTSPAKAAVAASSGVTAGDTGFGAMRWDAKIVWFCLHLLLFLVPVAMGNLTFLGIGGGMPISFDQFDIVKLFVMRATTLIAIGAWGAGMLIHGGRVRRTKVDWLILAFLVWVLVSSFFSIHFPTAIFGKYRRFEGWLSFVNYALVFFLISQVADRSSRIRSLSRTLVLSSMFVTWYGLLQYFGRDFIQWGTLPFEFTRSFSTYGNPDLLGGLLVLALPVAAAMALSESSRLWRTVYWVATFMLCAVMITAFTRGAWIGGFVAVCALLFAVWRARPRLQVLDWGFAGLSVLAVIAIIVRSLSNPNQVLNFAARFTSIFQFNEGSAASRFQIWQAAINAIRMEPIFGFGADTFRLVFPFTKTEAYVQQVGYLSVADNVHNYPLQLMAGIGIPGFLIMYGLIGYALVSGARFAFPKDMGAARLLQAGLWAAVLGYVVHLIFGLSVTGTTVIMWTVMALVLAPTATSIEVAPMRAGRSALRVAAASAIIVVVGALSVFNIRYLMADRYYLMGRIGPYDTESRIRFLERAIQLSPSNDMYRAEVGLQYQNRAAQFVGQIQQASAQGQDTGALITSMRDSFLKAEQAILDTIEFVPPEYDNYVFLASLYNLGGDILTPDYYDKAIDIARRGVEVQYFGPAIRLQLARALASKGLNEEAKRELELAVRFDPAYAEAKQLYVSVLIEQGDYGRAREVLEQILAANPEDAFASSQLQRIPSTAAVGATQGAAP